MDSGSPTRLRVAVVGVGAIGPRHARTVKANDDTELVAIVDPMPSSVSLAEELETAYFKSVPELLQSAHKPDVAIICTPNHTHMPIAQEFVSEGVHVLIEKPVSADVPSARAFIKQLEGTTIKALVGHHRRFNPYMVTTKQVIESGSLGSIVAINGLWALYKPSEYFDAPAEWRRGEAGGVVLINMVHEVDLLHFIFGPITRVHAEKMVSRRGFEAEEGAALTIRFRSGAVGTFLLSDNVPSPYNFEAGTGENPMVPKTGQDFYRIFGTDASLSVPDMSLWSYKGRQRSWHTELRQEKISVPHSIPLEHQLDHLVKVVRNEEEPNCTIKAGLAALLVCQAIKKALESDSTVEIEKYEV